MSMSKSKNSDLGPSIPRKIELVSSALKRSGAIAFWLQIFFGVISSVLLLVASASLLGSKQKTPGIELGVFCAFSAVIALGIAIIFSFRFSQMGRKMEYASSEGRPRKQDTLQTIKYGLIVNLTGIFLSILGAEALAGIVLLKTLTLPQVTLGSNPTQFVNSVDLLIIQANTNTIFAHFTGLTASLWLLNRISK